jgi:hypothetical protein
MKQSHERAQIAVVDYGIRVTAGAADVFGECFFSRAVIDNAAKPAFGVYFLAEGTESF